MKILNREITRESAPYLIGEIGHNHQGDVKRAMSMMSTLLAAGFHAGKLQKRSNRAMFTSSLYNSPYSGHNSYGDTYGEHREKLEFGKSDYKTLIEWGEEIGLHFFATAFDEEAADFLMDLAMPAFKIASGDIVNTPLLRKVANLGRPLFVSTGGASLEDVKRAVDLILPLNPQLCILQCTASYPCPPEGTGYDVFNLRVIQTYLKAFPDCVIGFSDHQSGIAFGPAAVALGATVFEKHVTFDRAAKGTDHPFSLEPVGQKKYARDIQRTYEALNDGVKRRFDCENAPLRKMAKSIYASEDIPHGAIITRSMLSLKTPADGLPPYLLESIIGRKTKRFIGKEELITMEDLE